jgi:hypothetical protein
MKPVDDPTDALDAQRVLVFGVATLTLLSSLWFMQLPVGLREPIAEAVVYWLLGVGLAWCWVAIWERTTDGREITRTVALLLLGLGAAVVPLLIIMRWPEVGRATLKGIGVLVGVATVWIIVGAFGTWRSLGAAAWKPMPAADVKGSASNALGLPPPPIPEGADPPYRLFMWADGACRCEFWIIGAEGWLRLYDEERLILSEPFNDTREVAQRAAQLRGAARHNHRLDQ